MHTSKENQKEIRNFTHLFTYFIGFYFHFWLCLAVRHEDIVQKFVYCSHHLYYDKNEALASTFITIFESVLYHSEP